MKMEGKFLLSYNDCAYIRELYDRDGIFVESVSRLNNIKQRYDMGSQFEEVLIANYDLYEREHIAPRQVNLFEYPVIDRIEKAPE